MCSDLYIIFSRIVYLKWYKRTILQETLQREKEANNGARENIIKRNDRLKELKLMRAVPFPYIPKGKKKIIPLNTKFISLNITVDKNRQHPKIINKLCVMYQA